LKNQLQNLQQGPKSCSDYLQDAKNCTDQLAAVGKPIGDDDFISFVMNGLNSSFISFVTSYSIAPRDHQPSFDDFHDELLNHEMLLNQQRTTAPDQSTFALFSQKPNIRNFQPRNRGYQGYQAAKVST
jgi:hypothetical protein